MGYFGFVFLVIGVLRLANTQHWRSMYLSISPVLFSSRFSSILPLPPKSKKHKNHWVLNENSLTSLELCWLIISFLLSILLSLQPNPPSVSNPCVPPSLCPWIQPAQSCCNGGLSWGPMEAKGSCLLSHHSKETKAITHFRVEFLFFFLWCCFFNLWYRNTLH